MHITPYMLDRMLVLYAASRHNLFHCLTMRPHNNPALATHKALLRRGLIREADDERGTTSLTKTGLDVLHHRLVGLPSTVVMARAKAPAVPGS